MKKQTKTRLSRILCIALILCMILALIPAAFAETTEETKDFKIDFLNGGTDPGINGKDYGEKIWAFHSSSVGVEYKNAYGLRVKSTDVNQYAAIKLKAPESGNYQISYNYYKARTGNKTDGFFPNGGIGKVSLIAYNEASANTDINMALRGTDADLFTGVEYGSVNYGANETEENPIKYLEKNNEYLLIISCTGSIDNGTKDNFNMYATSFTFTPYDIENAVYSFEEENYPGITDPSHITYENSNGRVEFHSTTAAPKTYITLWSSDSCFEIEGGYVAYKLNVPAAGTYKAKLEYISKSNSDSAADFYILPLTDAISTEEETPVFENVNLSSDGTAIGTFTAERAGEHLLVMRDSNGGFVRLSKITLSNNPSLSSGAGTIYTIDTTERLNVGDTANVTVNAYDAVTGNALTSPNVEIVSSDDSIVSVSGGKITAHKTGVAELSATIDGFEATCEVAVVGNVAADEAETVSFGVYSDVANSVTVSGVDNYSVNTVGGANSGTTITVTAEADVDGRIFRGWKRGSKDNGVFISDEKTLSLAFTLTSNTFLTAVYDDAANDAAAIEFYNYNGQFVASKEINGSAFSLLKPADPSLTGYSFDGWTQDGTNIVSDETVFEKLTRVMAKYTKESGEYRISVVGYRQSITDAIQSGRYAYDTELTFSSKSGNKGLWTVNGKPVFYGNTYTHIVWCDAEINFIEEAYSGPILSIDETVKENGARVISYDANGADIIEVGILFGKGANLGSFSGKAASKKTGNVNGQFTATPSNGVDGTARGYLIYDDNGTKKVIYAD